MNTRSKNPLKVLAKTNKNETKPKITKSQLEALFLGSSLTTEFSPSNPGICYDHRKMEFILRPLPLCDGVDDTEKYKLVNELNGLYEKKGKILKRSSLCDKNIEIRKNVGKKKITKSSTEKIKPLSFDKTKTNTNRQKKSNEKKKRELQEKNQLTKQNKNNEGKKKTIMKIEEKLQKINKKELEKPKENIKFVMEEKCLGKEDIFHIKRSRKLFCCQNCKEEFENSGELFSHKNECEFHEILRNSMEKTVTKEPISKRAAFANSYVMKGIRS